MNVRGCRAQIDANDSTRKSPSAVTPRRSSTPDIACPSHGASAITQFPIIGPYTEMRTSLRKALDSALLDDKDARESLEKADAEVNAELKLYAQDIGG